MTLAAETEQPVFRPPDEYEGVRQMIWIYFWLLIFEGAIRKWVFPQYASVILLIRDPVLLLCYFIAWRQGLFPKSIFVTVILLLGVLSFIVSLAVSPVEGRSRLLLITLYGFHADFFHLPLIFLIRDAFNREQIMSYGRWLMILSPFMAVLVFLQYRGGEESFLNRGAGVNARQIWSGVNGLEKIRPAGTFSYNTGLGGYLCLVAAFVLNQVLGAKRHQNWLFVTASISLVFATVLAISRTTFGTVAIVYIAALCAIPFIPRVVSRSFFAIGAVSFVAVAVQKLSVLGEGLSILSARIEESGGTKVGIIDRIVDGFAEPFRVLHTAGFLGAGIGLGTNAGGQVMTGERAFYLGTETEWARNLLEGGALLGIPYILLRIALCVYLTKVAVRSLRSEEPLSFLLLSTCVFNVLIAQFGVSMTVGFTIFSAGLCLAAARAPGEVPEDTTPGILQPRRAQPARPGRSTFAEQLHAGSGH